MGFSERTDIILNKTELAKYAVRQINGAKTVKYACIERLKSGCLIPVLPVPRKFPQRCLWNSSNDRLTDDGRGKSIISILKKKKKKKPNIKTRNSFVPAA